MTKTIRLNDLQLVLLSSAAARDNGSLIPLPDNCTHDRPRIGKAVATLLRRSLIEEIPVTDRSLTWREQDQQILGLFITDAGRAAIGAEPEHVGQDDAGVELESIHVAGKAAVHADTGQLASPETDAPAPASVAPRASSKIAAVVALLGRAEGATLDEMVEVTGWLPHTTRAALTGLRKKGHAITKTKRGDVSCYRIEAKVAA
jgi:hypothetical protein